MKEDKGKTIINVIVNGSSYLSDEYTIVVVVQNPAQLGLLLPTAIDIAKLHHGRVILLNIIEIPYQLPPSAARKFIMEQEPFLRQGLKVLKNDGCRGSMAIRLAHNTDNAIKRYSRDKNANIVIREDELGHSSNNIFNRLIKSITSWF